MAEFIKPLPIEQRLRIKEIDRIIEGLNKEMKDDPYKDSWTIYLHQGYIRLSETELKYLVNKAEQAGYKLISGPGHKDYTYTISIK